MEALMKAVEGLSEKDMATVIEFAEFLRDKEKKEEKQNDGKFRRELGIFKGSLKYMADDFDETPECFKEYM